MLSSKIYSLFRTILLSTLLITSQTTKPLFFEKFDFTAYQYYIIACITSCCIGALLCTLIQKYCCKQSTIIPEKTPKKENIKQQLFEQLHQKIDTTQTTIESIQEDQKKTINLLIEQNNNINQKLFEQLDTKIYTIKTEIEKLIREDQKRTTDLLIEQNNSIDQFINLCRDNVQTRMADLAFKIKLLKLKQQQQKFLELSQLLTNNNTNLFIASTLYLFKEYKEKIKECETYKEQLNIAQPQRIIHNNDDNKINLIDFDS